MVLRQYFRRIYGFHFKWPNEVVENLDSQHPAFATGFIRIVNFYSPDERILIGWGQFFLNVLTRLVHHGFRELPLVVNRQIYLQPQVKKYYFLQLLFCDIVSGTTPTRLAVFRAATRTDQLVPNLRGAIIKFAPAVRAEDRSDKQPFQPVLE